ncbi:MAG: DJ-1/PfpI family protein [Deltaproteobacteria bacterium]|nr:DJ-1/PfpI family protein [Deltaproteobacteria bacterium]MBW2723001.1 DJ-1/PfpI family protein [Deltaproteobacteria bacterium]
MSELESESSVVGIVLFPDAEELDWAGPYEVFTMAAMGQDSMRVVTIAQTMDPVRCAKGLRVLPDHCFEDAPTLDVVLVPGGQGSRTEMNNAAMLEFLQGVAPGCSWITSVCTGAVILCKAGLTKGRRITTHWGYIEALREIAGDSEVLEQTRYVRDGRLVTAAGVSAGIDMSLWLVGQMFSPEHARNTQRMMEYDPAPPYSAAV